MTDKLIPQLSSSATHKQGEMMHTLSVNASSQKSGIYGRLPPAVLQLEEKIQLLKKKKEKIQIQQALLFIKEAQKIFNEDFSLDLALIILSETWNKASQAQKEEWRKRNHFFRPLSLQNNGKKAEPSESTSHQN
jgi:hypothetical protein